MNIKQQIENERYHTTYQALEEWYEKQKKQRNKAFSECKGKTLLYGTATAELRNELQADVSLTIVPLGIGNLNGQGIDASEASNILNSILYMPLRARFDGERLYGHADADDIGTIIAAHNIDGIIKADGVIWREKHKELTDYIMAHGEVGSSFEIGYRTSEIRNGVEWLSDVAFLAQCLVAHPAYPNTPARLA